jgi:formate/nitrite transporter FocA (FNT family)
MSAAPDAPTPDPARPEAGTDEREEREEREEAIKEQTRPNAVVIHETIRLEGQRELDRTVSALLLSGLAAGLSMGFSLIAEGVLHAHLADTPYRELIVSFGYTVGFLVVVLGRQQLFTENTLTPILPLLHNRDGATFWRVARLWGVVLVANVAATWLISYACLHSGVFDDATRDAFLDLSRPSIASPFATTFFKAVFAGWLIALMVWLLPAAEVARVPVILILTYFVAAGRFSHIIAGSVDASYLVHAGAASLGDYVGAFFLPTLCGNIVGGIALVAMLNYGQVAPDI